MHQIVGKKYTATEQEKCLNQGFMNNSALQAIAQNPELATQIQEKSPIDWQLHSEYVDLLYKQILSSEIYQKYQSPKEHSPEQQKRLVVELFEEIIAPNEKLSEFLEDVCLTWSDDFPVINTLIVRVLSEIGKAPESVIFLPKLYRNPDDKDFASELLKKAILNDEKYQQYLVGKTPNWDSERIAPLDAIIIKMGITEFLKFPSIPVRVTLNEYLEIAKEYSTPRSSLFINGILDSLVKDFQEQKILKKIGRGLL